MRFSPSFFQGQDFFEGRESAGSVRTDYRGRRERRSSDHVFDHSPRNLSSDQNQDSDTEFTEYGGVPLVLCRNLARAAWGFIHFVNRERQFRFGSMCLKSGEHEYVSFAMIPFT